MKVLSLFAGCFLLSSSAFAVGPKPFGRTFGTGKVWKKICGPTLIMNQTLAQGEEHGVMHHFWTTGSPGQIDRVWVSYYVDGESEPSIEFQPSMMCGSAFPNEMNATKEYSAGGLCGKSATTGGWWNTYPIPFYKSITIMVHADQQDKDHCPITYFNFRGTVDLPLVMPGSGLPLPMPGTRLILQKNPMAVRQPTEEVKVAELPAGQRGMMFQVSWAVETKPDGGTAAGGGYIEGCWNFYGSANESFPGLVAGTGLEDYFDSAYYFGADSGLPLGVPFTTPLSGLTLFERTDDGFERLSAYRFHNSDPLVMTDGGSLKWYVGYERDPDPKAPQVNKCGSVDASDSTYTTFTPDPMHSNNHRPPRKLTPVSVTTYAWIYTFAPSLEQASLKECTSGECVV